jgi:hypothetical protein
VIHLVIPPLLGLHLVKKDLLILLSINLGSLPYEGNILNKANAGKGSTFSSVKRTGTSLGTTDNIALGLNEHLYDFLMATKAKDY